jgi:pyruvate dehydrogenase E2 component (dihydrolipoamide acetyltransferase)
MHEIKLPKLGQSVEEAAIVQWLKKEGDPVQEGEPIFTIQTDKAEIECESTASGILRKILVQPDIEVPVMTVVALVGAPDEALPDLAQYGLSGGAAAVAPVESAPSPSAPVEAAPLPGAASGTKSPVSPRARKLAEEKGIDPSTLSGTGVMGRVMEADVLAAFGAKATPTAKRMAANAGIALTAISGTGIAGKITKADVAGAMTAATAATAAAAVPPAGLPEGIKRVPLTPMRRIIAERMAASKFAAPHYYVTVEIDMSKAKALRAKLPFKVSYNDLVLYAAVRAIREFPAVNVQWAGDALLQMPDVNLGVAVALPTGLIVPVIKQAHTLSLEGMAAAAKSLATKAQNNKLLPDDYTGNTFTVSNLGAYGVDHFTAIINQPDSAILAVGQMKDRPVVVDGGIHIRPIMKITMSSDHRLVDGAIAAQFMGKLKEILETADF